MSKIDDVFQRLKKEESAALMPFLPAGDPNLEMTREFILEMEKNGADIIELGVPFSDPLADGPTIQRSSQRALSGGVTLTKILAFLKELRKETSVPIVLMGYYNPIFHYGVERFAQDAREAGADGVIVPDLPPEEAGDLIQAARKVGLDTIFLLAPTSTRERIERVVEVSRGFVYYVSLTGVTGERGELALDIGPSLTKIRDVTPMPICVGFGISTADHVQSVSRLAEGVIVGSAVVSLIEKEQNKPDCPVRVGAFIRELRQATKSPL